MHGSRLGAAPDGKLVNRGEIGHDVRPVDETRHERDGHGDRYDCPRRRRTPHWTAAAAALGRPRASLPPRALRLPHVGRLTRRCPDEPPPAVFTAQPHSFTQQARLAITLSWIGGYTNMIALLTCGQAVSHVTGTTSALGGRLAEGEFTFALFAAMLLGMFGLGAAAAGFMLEVGRSRRWDSLYVWPMAVEAGLLAVFAILVEFHDARTVETGWPLWLMTGIAALAMGLQNATITRISGGVVRTTHVTGVVTDIGLEGAQVITRWIRWVHETQRQQQQRQSPGHADGRAGPWRALLRAGARKAAGVIRGRRPEGAPTTLKRLALLITILAAFGFGTFVGAFAFSLAPQWSMLPPVVLLVWVIAQDLLVPIADVTMLRPGEVLLSGGGIGATTKDDRSDRGRVLPPEIAVFHIGSRTGAGDSNVAPARPQHQEVVAGQESAAAIAERGRDGRGSRGGGGGGVWRRPRMPNLTAWADAHLPEEARVIVLDVSAFQRGGGLDTAACLEIASLARSLGSGDEGRLLVLGGVNAPLRLQLRNAGAMRHLEARNLCRTPGLAVARAIMLLERATRVADEIEADLDEGRPAAGLADIPAAASHPGPVPRHLRD